MIYSSQILEGIKMKKEQEVIATRGRKFNWSLALSAERSKPDAISQLVKIRKRFDPSHSKTIERLRIVYSKM